MAEIKISDLSVGDWIATESAQLAIECNDIATAFVDKVKKPIQIVSVLGAEQLVFGRIEELDGFTTIYLKAEHIKPIPLTTEILEKNGLCVVEEEADFSEYELFGSENFSIFHLKGTFHYRLETPQASVVCWCVHQLQNALRLAGVEKEIEV